MKKLMTVGCAALTAFAGLMEAPAETLGFWAFNDGAAGTEVSTVANSAGSGTFAGTAAKTTTSGSLPTFSADSPGRIVSSSRAETVLCETSQSVAFRYPSRTNRQSGLIDLDGVADALVGKGSFTLEWFVKMDESYAYWQDGDGTYDQISKTLVYLEASKDVGGFKFIAPQAVYKSGDLVGHANGFALQEYQNGKVIANSVDGCDGCWHHVALVYDETDATAQSGTLTFYFDYAKVNQMAYANATSAETGLKFRLGTGYKDGKGSVKTTTEPANASLAALRVSSGALSVEDFEVAANGSTVFSLGFNKENAASGEKLGTALNTALDLDLSSDFGVLPTATFIYGLHADAYPVYAIPTYRQNRMVLWGGKRKWRNLAGCRFLGYNSLAEGTSLRQYAGTKLCVLSSVNPQNWTMEAFVKMEAFYGGANGVLLFGKAGTSGDQSNVDPQYCWMLTRIWSSANKAYCLRLSWVEKNETGAYSASDCHFVETPTDVLGDGAWHHLAVSYEASTRTFKVFADSAVVQTAQVGETGLLDSTAGYFFSRLGCTSGFEGRMDEIRLSSEALEPKDFITFEPEGIMITIR